MPTQSDVNFRYLENNDIADIVAMAKSRDRIEVPSEWDILLQNSNSIGAISCEGELLSRIIFSDFQSRVSVGKLMTAKASLAPRISNLGLKTLRELMDRFGLHNRLCSCIVTDAARSLNAEVGFKLVSHVEILIFDSDANFHDKINSSRAIIPFCIDHMHSINELDKEAFGADRSIIIYDYIRRDGLGFSYSDETGILRGYGVLKAKGMQPQIGPIVAEDYDAALKITCKLINESQGTVRIDVPSVQQRFISELERLGFRRVGKAPVLSLGGKELPGNLYKVFGICNQMIG